MDVLNYIANQQFGLDYDQLGQYEQAWCRDELDNLNYTLGNNAYNKRKEK